MKDIQSLHDDRRINIRKVGVKTVSYPVTVLDRRERTQRTVATVNMYVNLPHRFKGTHMSRFVEILNRYHGAFNLRTFRLILQEMKGRLEAEAAHLEIEFPYFFRQDTASEPGEERYLCRMHGSLKDTDDLVMEIEVPIVLPRPGRQEPGLPRSLGRWGQARVAVRFHRFIWIEELIEMVHNGLPGAGEPVGAVEPVCLGVGSVLADHPDIAWYRVVVENLAPGYTIFASVSGPESGSGNGEQERQELFHGYQ